MEMDKILATDLLKKAYSASLSLDMRQYKEYMTEAAEIVEKLHGDSEAYRQLQGEMLLVSLVECINDFDELSARVEKPSGFSASRDPRSSLKAPSFSGDFTMYSLCAAHVPDMLRNISRSSRRRKLFFSE